MKRGIENFVIRTLQHRPINEHHEWKSKKRNEKERKDRATAKIVIMYRRAFSLAFREKPFVPFDFFPTFNRESARKK